MPRPRRRRLSRFADYAIPWGVGIFLVLVVGDEEQRRDDIPGFVVLLGMLVAAAQGLILRWRRERPELVMALALLGGAGTMAIVPSVVLPVAGLFAVWSLAAARPPRRSLIGLAGLEALAAVNFTTASSEDAIFAVALAATAWALGEAARNRDLAIAEEARRAVSEEQTRIARELHDVIAHSVSVIVVQAAAADDVFDERPDQARSALRSIERSGRDALAELRRLLAAVRPAAEDDPTHPQPGLDRLDELAERLGRASGLDVVVNHEGTPRPLPAGLELSAYRIVQEALTNTLRHAAATRAEVVVRQDGDTLEIEVRDNGHGAPGANGGERGHGLLGMRERAAMHGGELDAGSAPEGGFRVRARFPVEAAG